MRIGLSTLVYRRAAGSATMPASSIACTKGAALPSMIGASGPSSSTMALSTPSPHSAAMMCSIVETPGPEASPSTVASSVAVTDRALARISRCRLPPTQRMKTTPVPASAGCNVSVTGSPEWTPIPETAARLRSVVCLPAFMPRSAPSPHRLAHDERTRSATPDGLPLAVDGREFYRADRCRPRSPDAVSPYDEHINHASGQVQFTVFYRLLPLPLTTGPQTKFRRWLVLLSDSEAPSSPQARPRLRESLAPEARGTNNLNPSRAAKTVSPPHAGRSPQPVGEAKRVRRNADTNAAAWPGSVRLAAQERRDLQVILIDRIVHRCRPAVRVEPLRGRPGRGRALGIFGDRVVRLLLPSRRGSRSTGCSLRLRSRRRIGLLGHGLLLFAPAEADRG